MARFDVYRVEGDYFLDIQTNLLPSFGTRLVIPLVSPDLPMNSTESCTRSSILAVNV